MADIRFDTGIKEYNLNGAVTVRFCPTDMTFIEKIYNAMDSMDKKTEAFRAESENIKEAEMFELAHRMDESAREEINELFGMDVCTPLFGSLSLFAVADGLPIWANLILAVIDQLDGAFAEEKKKTNPRIAKYTAKYKR